MDAFWVSGLMFGMYFLGSFVTWYLIKGIDDHDYEMDVAYYTGYNDAKNEDSDDPLD